MRPTSRAPTSRTETGCAARMLAKYLPKAPILATSMSETSTRRMLYVRGVTLTAPFQGTDSGIAKALTKAKELGVVIRSSA